MCLQYSALTYEQTVYVEAFSLEITHEEVSPNKRPLIHRSVAYKRKPTGFLSYLLKIEGLLDFNQPFKETRELYAELGNRWG